MTNTLTDIAQAIRQHSPDALPRSLRIDDGRLCFVEPGKDDNGATDLVTNWYTPLPDDIAEAVLVAAMVRDSPVERFPGDDSPSWVSYHIVPRSYSEQREFYDSDHGGPLGACYAAWKWAKGIA